MIRIIQIGTVVGTAAIVAFISYWIAFWAHHPHQVITDGAPMRVISSWFYPPSIWPYLFPLPLTAAGLALAFKVPIQKNMDSLFLVASICSILLFIMIFLLALILPWTDLYYSPRPWL